MIALIALMLAVPTTIPSNVAYKASGGTSRSLASKLSDVVSVRDYGAVGDGVTDDTAAVQGALAQVSASGGILNIPPGTYIIDATALASGATQNLYIRGAGMERTILKAKSPACGDVIHIDAGAAYFQRIEVADLTLVGCGPTDVNGGGGISITTSNVVNQVYLHDMSVRDCAGKGVYITNEFSSRLVNVMVNNCGDNLFDLSGGNTTTLVNTYAQTVRTGKVGYRIHGRATLISANGINNDWGSANQDQADWGVFGDELLTAWAQNTAYTIGQLRSANGQEYEVTTAGTSNVAGTGPSTISASISDGTVTWRHVGSADAANSFAEITCIGCNVEAPTRSGIRLKANSLANFFSTKFVPAASTPTPAAGVIALWMEFVDPQQAPVLIDGQAFANETTNHYDHSAAIHVTSGGAAFVRFGGTNNAPTVYHRQNAVSILPATISQGGAWITGSSIYSGVSISRLSATQFVCPRVAPTYGVGVTINPTLGCDFDVTATNGTAFTLNNPGDGSSNFGMAPGQKITTCIINTSGGALGALSVGTKYKIGAAWVQPATANRRCIEWQFDGTNWYETWRSAADVAN